MKRPKIDHAAATLELRASGLEPVEPYPGVTSKPFAVRCIQPKCKGHVEPFPAYLSVVRSLAKKGRVGCVHCNKRHRANQRRTDMIRLGNMLPMVEIPDVKTAVRSWCLRCWRICEPGPRLDNIKNGKQGGCEHCGGKRRLSDDVARQRAREWGYSPDPDIPYTNDATKWPGRCLAKGHYCEPVLNSQKRQGPCESCADHGFKPHLPAILYLVVKPDLVAAKIGICEDSPKNRRLYEHALNGWITIETMRFAVGADARRVETALVQSWRARNLQPVLDNGYGYEGYTETVSLNATQVSEIWPAVVGIAERVLATPHVPLGPAR
ncbi:hypothetical protein [Streptomyces dysideae]|uniref:Uncharacterized protein n=1 Tax=Streptomyces dysideae TaxID=909626 RepID=A0A101V456_9ACTN|nr:hypothetical protein [Streptomyces dysideae]KUO22153.1 hypothetical protein AQJ91_06165 [Streptomyces dysideae]